MNRFGVFLRRPRRAVTVLGVTANIAAMLFVNTACAQDYPNRTVRIIVPSVPGGVVDFSSRLLAPKLSELWNQAVVVENRAGGNGIIGMESASKAAPDGYTLMMGIGSDFSITPHFYVKFPLNPLTAFAPILLVSDNPLMFAANAAAPFNNVREMIAYAKSQPGGLSFSSPGAGSHNHLIGERFALETGIKMVHVAYKGGGPAGAAIITGEVPVGILAAPSAVPHIKSGRMKAIAVTMARRIPVGPDWPTLNESGVPGFDASNWVALTAPAGTPREIIAKINADTNQVLRMADVRERMSASGSEVIGSSAEAAGNRMRDDSERYSRLVRQLNLRFD